MKLYYYNVIKFLNFLNRKYLLNFLINISFTKKYMENYISYTKRSSKLFCILYNLINIKLKFNLSSANSKKLKKI